MKFRVLPVNSDIKNYPSGYIYLVEDNWNDWWEYKTQSYVYYKDDRGEITPIGSVKIAEKNMQDNQEKVTLKEEFDALEPHQFSLGQDQDYYEVLNRLGDQFRDDFLKKMNDLSFYPELLHEVNREQVIRKSLMRDIGDKRLNTFKLLAQGISQLQPYDFKYKVPHMTNESFAYELHFQTKPNSNPPSNLYAIIGRNGVGKSHLLRGMVEDLLGLRRDEESKRFQYNKKIHNSKLFANVIYVSFSAFDDNQTIGLEKDKKIKTKYSYIGLKKSIRIDNFKENKNSIPNYQIITKSTEELKKELVDTVWKCKRLPSKRARLQSAIDMLSSDPIFATSGVEELLSTSVLETELNTIDGKRKTSDEEKKIEQRIYEEYEREANKICKKFSSGHSIVLLTIANLISQLEESTLVLLDEPESHLHPPLLSSFTRVLSDLLFMRNGIGIIATHSPVVVQEIPCKCVWIFDRSRAEIAFRNPDIETFGENLTVLTREVFSFELTNSGFHKLLSDAAYKSTTYEDALASFNDELGMQAQAILKAMMNLKKESRSDEEN